MRLFGVNLVLSANLPSSSDAARIARRLRKLGVNLVRLHNIDSTETGFGPMWMEPVGATVALDLAGSAFTVFPLDRTGARLASISVQGRRFQLQSSPWYEVVVGATSISR